MRSGRLVVKRLGNDYNDKVRTATGRENDIKHAIYVIHTRTVLISSRGSKWCKRGLGHEFSIWKALTSPIGLRREVGVWTFGCEVECCWRTASPTDDINELADFGWPCPVAIMLDLTRRLPTNDSSRQCQQTTTIFEPQVRIANTANGHSAYLTTLISAICEKLRGNVAFELEKEDIDVEDGTRMRKRKVGLWICPRRNH
ncbi:hypothetical protein DL96DRAFT_1564646 [Flagelloscypha sp. PMI_526]|nr:hypothetical protein DL96DRAFT_1564646 [Flagelloscypha sp. PMI_526]